MSTQEYERQWAYIGDTTYRETEDELVMRIGSLSYGVPKVHRILDSFVLAADSPVLRLRTIEVEYQRTHEATVKIGKKPDRREYTWRVSRHDPIGCPCIIKDRYPYTTGDLKCHYEIARPNYGNPVLLFEIEGPKGQVDAAAPSLISNGWIETTRMPDFGGLLLAVCGRPPAQRIAAMSAELASGIAIAPMAIQVEDRMWHLQQIRYDDHGVRGDDVCTYTDHFGRTAKLMRRNLP